MHERRMFRDEVPTEVGKWNPFEIANVLGASPEYADSLHYGEGARYQVGPELSTTLSVYPDHNTVEVMTPDMVISLRRPANLTLLADSAFFDVCTPEHHASVIVSSDGTVNVIATQPLTEPPAETDDELVEVTHEEPRRLIMVGALLHEPHVTQTADGEPVIRFPMVTASEPPEYHNIYSTKKHATRIIEKELRRGDPVKVVGVRHEFPDGEKIYAYGVKRSDEQEGGK